MYIYLLRRLVQYITVQYILVLYRAKKKERESKTIQGTTPHYNTKQYKVLDNVIMQNNTKY